MSLSRRCIGSASGFIQELQELLGLRAFENFKWLEFLWISNCNFHTVRGSLQFKLVREIGGKRVCSVCISRVCRCLREPDFLKLKRFGLLHP